MSHKNALAQLQKGGVIPAMPLALDGNRHWDERRQRALIRYYLEAGVHGVAVGVHTTQFNIRDPRHNLLPPVLALAAEEITAYEKWSGRTVVKIAGACGPETQAAQEAELAGRLGYDAVLLSPGGLTEASEASLLNRTKAVSPIMPVIGFYLQPAVGGRFLSFDYWRRLADIEGVAAIKAAPFNRYQTLDVIRGVAFSDRADEVALYTGNDDNIVIDLLSSYTFTRGDGKSVTKRFAGGLLGHWSVWTKKVVALFDTLMACRNEASIPAALLTLANEITDANAAFFDAHHQYAGCLCGIHRVLQRQGLFEGITCLDENETLSPGQYEEIERVYEAYPHLNDDAFVRENLSRWMEG